MEIVEILSKLGFSFWQVVILLVIFLFIREIKEIFKRISTFKIGKNEIVLKDRASIVEELQNLKDSIEYGKSPNAESIRELIDARIRSKFIGSMVNINNKTSYLWKAIERTKANNLRIIKADIRGATLDQIYTDLSLMHRAGLFSFKVDPTNHSSNDVVVLTLNHVSNEFFEIAEEANRL